MIKHDTRRCAGGGSRRPFRAEGAWMMVAGELTGGGAAAGGREARKHWGGSWGGGARGLRPTKSETGGGEKKRRERGKKAPAAGAGTRVAGPEGPRRCPHHAWFS